MIDSPYRPARPADASPLAELVNMAGEGLPLYLWTGMAEAGETPWDVGFRRARRESGSFSYSNAIVREDDGHVVAALIGYPLADEPDSTDLSQMPPMFVPLQELEDLAPATWYVNVLATYPEHRGKGFGSELLTIAETLAADTGRKGLSIIVSDGNPGAVRLYLRSGYTETATRPMVKETWQNPGQNWVLLAKPL